MNVKGGRICKDLFCLFSNLRFDQNNLITINRQSTEQVDSFAFSEAHYLINVLGVC